MQTENIVTDESYLERRAHGGTDFAFRYYEEDVFAFAAHRIDWHWHREVEFVYAARGDIFCSVGGDLFVLKEGCGLFVNGGVLHRYEAKQSAYMPNILFLPMLLGEEYGRIYQKYIAPVLKEGAEYMILQNGVEDNKILTLLLTVFEIQKDGGDELDTVGALLSLWKELYNVLPRTKLQGDKSLNFMRLRLMMEFIHKNFDQRITLQDIASAVYISKNAALQIFRETICISPVGYLIQYRLTRAASLLTSEETSVARIAERCGFESSGYFCRKFRAFYGLSPLEYRKNKCICQTTRI